MIPPNIAPLNFLVEEPGVEYRVRIHGAEGEDIIIGSRNPSIVIPPRPWRRLLAENRGGRIVFDVYAKDGEGRWSRFHPFSNDVAREEIDSHLVYRLLGPVCSLYHNMGVYQRNLESYDQSPILTTDAVDGCMNCHSFANNRPDLFALQVRPGMGKKTVQGGMFVVRGGQAVELKTQSKAAPQRPSYIAWHPSGSVIAFSMTKTKQFFHGAGAEIREVYDQASHLAIVNLQTGAVSTSPGIADPAMQEAFPCWSADGKMLYFCRAKTLWTGETPPRMEDLDKVKYDLMCVKYDVDKNELGLAGDRPGGRRNRPEHRRAEGVARRPLPAVLHGGLRQLLSLPGRQRSVLDGSQEPQVPAAGVQQPGKRIVALLVEQLAMDRLQQQARHPLLSRLYFSYIDSKGNAAKPFILPQKDPSGYDSLSEGV